MYLIVFHDSEPTYTHYLLIDSKEVFQEVASSHEHFTSDEVTSMARKKGESPKTVLKDDLDDIINYCVENGQKVKRECYVRSV